MRSSIFLFFLLFSFSTIQADEMENRVREIAHKLRCPTCQALSVKESDSGLASNMKMKIREMLIAGQSEEEILQYFEERYGEWILRSPKKEGFNLLLWVLPGLIILGVIGALVLRMKKGTPKPAVDDQNPLSDNERSQIADELKRIREE